jgi:hypothetical protein
MKLHLPFLSFPTPSRSADTEYACGMQSLNSQEERRASRHFRRAVGENPQIAIDIAEHCVDAKRPKLAIRVLDQYQRIPKPALDLDIAVHVASTYAAAHHALSHSRSGRFQSKHSASEVTYLKSVTYSSKAGEFDGFPRYSEALAERYCHLKFGMCFEQLRRSKPTQTAGREDVSLFINVTEIAFFRLNNGDSDALRVIEGLFDKGPPPREYPRVEPTLRRLRDSLTEYVERATGTSKRRAETILEAMRRDR